MGIVVKVRGYFLGTLNIRCRIILGIQSGTIIVDNHPYTKSPDPPSARSGNPPPPQQPLRDPPPLSWDLGCGIDNLWFWGSFKWDTIRV